MCFFFSFPLFHFFRCVHASLYEALSVRGLWSVVRRSRVSQISRKSTLRDNKTSGNNEFKLIQYNSSKFKQIQENSFILTYIGRIFVRIELVRNCSQSWWFMSKDNLWKLHRKAVGYVEGEYSKSLIPLAGIWRPWPRGPCLEVLVDAAYTDGYVDGRNILCKRN